MKKLNTIYNVQKESSKKTKAHNLSIILSNIANKSKKHSRDYVKNWVVPGGGE